MYLLQLLLCATELYRHDAVAVTDVVKPWQNTIGNDTVDGSPWLLMKGEDSITLRIGRWVDQQGWIGIRPLILKLVPLEGGLSPLNL